MNRTAYSVSSAPGFRGRIGVARADITPPPGIYARNWGAAKSDVAEGIHRPLTLTCLTFQSQRKGKPLVLIAADLGWWKSVDDEWFIRGTILKTFSLDPAAVMICLSHTHAGPSISSYDQSKEGGRGVGLYLRQLRAAAVRTVRRALKNAVSATLDWRLGKCDLASSRDLPERGSKRVVVGFNPSRPADDTLLAGRVNTIDGRPLAVLVNYACHPTTLAWDNRLISPDYVGAAREVIESQFGAPCLFLQGASGELAPAEQYVGDPAVADANGRRLGYAAAAALAAMLPAGTGLVFDKVVESGAALGTWKRVRQDISGQIAARMIEVPLPLKKLPSLAEIEEKSRRCADRMMLERLERQRAVRQAVGNGKRAPMCVWIWRVGDALLIGQPMEAYSHFQIELRRQLAPAAVAVMNVVNGHVGYLPPRALYGRDIYPAWQTPFARGSLELLTQTVSAAARQLLLSK